MRGVRFVGEYLLNVRGGSLLTEAMALGQFLVQLATGRILENEVDARLVVEVAEQAQDVGVAQVRLDLNLAPELMLNAGLL